MYYTNKVADDANAETYAMEYLNTVNISNFLLHRFKLKISRPISFYTTLVYPWNYAIEPKSAFSHRGPIC